MFLNVTISLLQSLAATMEIFFLTLLFSLPLGLVIAFGSMSKWAPLRFLLYGQEAPGALTRTLAAFRPIGTVCGILVWIIRGTPLMLQLIAVFYVPGLLGCGLWGGPVGRMSATVVTFTLNYACYFSVIYRGGIQGVPLGQREAGEVLGMTKRQIFFKVTLLQMIKRIVPPMSNEVINLVKDTSLARIIAVYELTCTGYSFMKSAGLIWPLFYSGAFYLLFVGVLTILFNRIERQAGLFQVKGAAIWRFWKYHIWKSSSAPPRCCRTSASLWKKGRPCPSSALPAAARPRCCGASTFWRNRTAVLSPWPALQFSSAADSPAQYERDIHTKRLHFGLVFQNFNLFPQYTALQNITLARELLAKEHGGESHASIEAARPSIAGTNGSGGSGGSLSLSTLRRPAAACGHRPRFGAATRHSVL